MAVLAVGGQVEGGAHLGRGAAEVEQHLVAGDVHFEVDADQPESDHVRFDVVAVPVASVGNVGDDAPGLGLRVVEHRVDRRCDAGTAVAVEQGVHPPFRGGEAGEARAHVSPVLFGRARIAEKELEEGAIELAFPVQALRRDADPLLVDLEARGRDAAGHPPADVVDVHEAPDVAHELPFPEHRFPQEHVREVGDHPAGAVGVVGDEDVAFAHVVAHPRDRVVHRHADHHQHAVAARCREHLALRAHENRAVVLRLLHEHGVRGAVDDLSHLVDHRLEAIDEDLERYLVEPGVESVHVRVPMRLRCGSISTRKPSGT